MGQNTRFDAVTKALMLVLLSLFTVQASMNRNASDRREENGNRLQVHIVPHSHDDAGWLKTFDQYYYGLRQDIQPAAVQVILDSVVEQLTQDANRRFTFAEMAFFMKYWSSLGESSRNQVSKLVAEDRLNFVNGGYVQHDEATAHFVAQLDQTTRGHLFLKETFNLTPCRITKLLELLRFSPLL